MVPFVATAHGLSLRIFTDNKDGAYKIFTRGDLNDRVSAWKRASRIIFSQPQSACYRIIYFVCQVLSRYHRLRCSS